MNTAVKLGAYIGGLALVFAGSIGVGQLIGPDRDSEPTTQAGHETTTEPEGGHDDGGHDESGDTGAEAAAELQVPGGLQIAQDGYRLVPHTSDIQAGTPTTLRFTVNGPDGRPATRFAVAHEKRLHLIVVRRDLTSFQHVHPEMAANGEWSVPLTLAEPGAYRMFADFQPAGAKDGLTLGADIFVPGEVEPRSKPKAGTISQVDGYEVRLDGKLEPGKTSKLTLTVSRDGKPVTDLQPYLGAFGHLVALRDGDLAYLHVHPEETAESGPGITFYAEVPSTGTYGLYLDFRHDNQVRTATFATTAEEQER